MVARKKHKTSFSLGEKIGVVALSFALLLCFVAPLWAILPLIVFVLMAFAAPFFPRFGFYLPVISCGKPGAHEIALTFDDGPSPQSTPILLDLLARHGLKATFFVIGEKAAKYPELIERILEGGHTIGNHSWDHDYFLMLRSPRQIEINIHKTQEVLAQFGIKPAVFRPPVGITGARLTRALIREDLTAVNYSCRAFDRGNRNIHNLAEKILCRIKPGSIIMLHDLPPYERTLENYYQKELDILFATLKKRYSVSILEQLIDRPTMLTL